MRDRGVGRLPRSGSGVRPMWRAARRVASPAMTGRGVAAALCRARGPPTAAAAYPDWRDPVSVGARRRACCASRRRSLRRLRHGRPGAGRARGAVRLRRRPALVLRAEVHARRALRAPLRRLRLRARAPRRDLGQREPDDRHGGWHRRLGRRRSRARVRARLVQFSRRALHAGRRVREPVRDVRLGARAVEPGHQRRPRAVRRRASTWATRTTTACSGSTSAPTGARTARRSSSAGAGTGAGQFDFVAGLSSIRRATTPCSSPTTATTASSASAPDGAFEALVGTLGSGPDSSATPMTRGSTSPGGCSSPTTRTTASCASTRAAGVHVELRRRGRAPGRLNNVRGIAVAPGPTRGRRVRDQHVAQPGLGVRGRRRVRAQLGRRRPRAGAFMQPRDVAVEANGDIVVADTRADRVQVLRADGRVDTWARISTALDVPTSGGGQREFRDPTGVAIDPRNGDVWVAEGGGTACRGSRRAASRPASSPTAGPTRPTPGRFTEPLGIAVAADGTVWVADTRNDRLQRRDPMTGPGPCCRVHRARPRSRCSPTAGSQSPSSGDPEDAAGRAGCPARARRHAARDARGTRPARGRRLRRPRRRARAETQRDRLLGSTPRLQPRRVTIGAGRFTRPMGTDVDSDGRLLVADTYANRVLRFERPRSRAGRGGRHGCARAVLTLGAGGALRPLHSRRGADLHDDARRRRALDRRRRRADRHRPEPDAPGRLVNGGFALARRCSSRARRCPRWRRLGGAGLPRPGDDRVLAVDRRQRGAAHGAPTPRR